MLTIYEIPPAVNATLTPALLYCPAADAPAECEPTGPAPEDARWWAEETRDESNVPADWTSLFLPAKATAAERAAVARQQMADIAAADGR